jgi:hypothetical protein
LTFGSVTTWPVTIRNSTSTACTLHALPSITGSGGTWQAVLPSSYFFLGRLIKDITVPPGGVNTDLTVKFTAGQLTATKPVGKLTLTSNDLAHRATTLTFGGSQILVGTAALTPENSTVGVGEPIDLSLAWTHPVGWRRLDSVDLLLVDDEGAALTVRWHEAENSFSLFNPAADRFVRTAEAGSPARFETSGATLYLRECTGGGPPGHTATINFNLSFKPHAAGRTFRVEASATDDEGNQQGFEPVGTITVLPR